MTTWMELESIMLSEISQAVKAKYHIISPISGTKSTKQANEQNRTRDMEIRKKLTVTRRGNKVGIDCGEMGGQGRGEQRGRNRTTVAEQQ